MAIQNRIFIGYLQNKEIKIYLKQSIKWQQTKMLGSAVLTETHWQDNDYIGLFVPSLLTHAQLKEKEQEVKTQLQLYCPKLNLDKHSILLFSQLFIL